MAKKVRFPLEMDNEVQVRTIEEFRENFSLARVMNYLQEGKLVIWLRDRYEDDLAESVAGLDLQDAELAKKICEIFDVPYDETSEEELKKAAERAERILKLKEYTDDREYEKVINFVAFDQEELYDLLDEEADTIYLCGEKFSIPLAKEGMSYIGINRPIVVINSKVEVDWGEKDISVENVVFDPKYQAVLDSANKVKEELYKKAVEKIESSNNNRKNNNLEKILSYLDLNYELLAKEIYEYDGKILFFEHKTRKQSDNAYRDSSILYSFDVDTKNVEFVKHFHEQDFRSQRVQKWLIYKEHLFYISSCERGLYYYLNSYNFRTDTIRTLDSWEGVFATATIFLEVSKDNLKYGSKSRKLMGLGAEEIDCDKLIELY
ncbi:MAG: hypothetical protein PUF29_16615 [Anaerobutyricum hallii]|uniref:hypothetical protein n=1 Tax=Anaerobutyricum hallii TaxID=39488 RepID=UPI00242B872B|nr:hypothetical protein [Anaerobutyricum hallii]MDD6590181.1 hypothetical protein [Anaerobutyricum hallii]